MKGLARRFENLMNSFTDDQKEKLIGSNSRLLNEEIDNLCNNIPSDKLVDALKELTESYNILSGLEKQYNPSYDKEGGIIKENWNFFLNALKELTKYPPYQAASKELYCKLYAIKYFTKGNFVDKEAVEDNIKHAIKDYFSQLLTNDPEEFTSTLFKLPIDFVGLVVRYAANNLAPELKDSLIPTKAEGEAFVAQLLDKKKDFITNIGKVVGEQHNVISISDARLLIDTRAFTEELDVHSGVLEYLTRLLNNKAAKGKLADLFGEEHIKELKANILAHPNYKKYLDQIKHGEMEPFFDIQGLANEKRSVPFQQTVDEYLNPELLAIRLAQEAEAAKQAELAAASAPPIEPVPANGEEEPEGGEEGGEGNLPVSPTPLPKNTPGNLAAEIPQA